MANEIKEALDRAAYHVQRVSEAPGPNAAAMKQTLLALIDAVVEIAATLPAPHTVPKT